MDVADQAPVCAGSEALILGPVFAWRHLQEIVITWRNLCAFVSLQAVPHARNFRDSDTPGIGSGLNGRGLSDREHVSRR